MALRKLSPGGHEYLTGSIACGDGALEPGQDLADYYLARGSPPGQWFGAGAKLLGVDGKEVTAQQLTAMFAEGRHPNASAIERTMIQRGSSAAEAMQATKLGRRFPRYGGFDEMREKVGEAYKAYNIARGSPPTTPLDDDVKAELRHQVQVEEFIRAHHRPPEDDKQLAGWLAQQRRALKTAVAGYEVVFAPPKSVSVAWALANRQSRELILRLHRQAVRDTITELEQTAAFTRKGSYGEAQVDIQGITVALFDHWDSRAGDAHLHTHGLISTKVLRQDGHWTALDGRTILAATVSLSESYNSRIRDLLREHGARFRLRPGNGIDITRPIWELAAIPDTLIAGFSRRAQQVELDRARRIVSFRHAHGREPTPKEVREIGRQAQYGTRAPKAAATTLAAHLARWRAFALTLVDQPFLDTLGARIFANAPLQPSAVDIAQVARDVRAVVSDHYSHWNQWHLRAEAHRQTAHLTVPATKRTALVTAIVDAALAAPDTVQLAAPTLVAEPDELRRKSGRSVFDVENGQRYTTEDTLRKEADLLRWAGLGGGRRLTADSIERAVAATGLKHGQRLLVAEFARSGRRLQLATAPAGTGKTTAMKVLVSAWQSAGGRVFALGPSARAAAELGKTIGTRPHTLHEVTTALAFGVAHHKFRFRPGDMLIIDEYAMAGTRTLHTVVQYALRRGAIVRMIGDDRQLGAVEAGGVGGLIARDIGTLRLDDVLRFHDPQQATASLQIRAGDPAGLAYYFDNNLVESGSRETMRDAALHAWRADLNARRETLLIVTSTEDLVALNLEARAMRIRLGAVSERRVVSLHDGTVASRGDWVVTRRNDRAVKLLDNQEFVKNGDTWRILRVHRDGRLRVRNREHGAVTTLGSAFVRANVELAYAVTAQRVQGMTVNDSAHAIVPPEMTREQFYPSVTRARFANMLYVITHHHFADNHIETPEPSTPESVLTGVLEHSEIETTATEELRHTQQNAESLATFVMRHRFAAIPDADTRYERMLEHHAPQLVDADAAPALRQTLQQAEHLGWNAKQLLADALAEGPLTTTRRPEFDEHGREREPAAILQWRVAHHIETRTPPPRHAPATVEQITRWRSLIDAHAPAVAVEDPEWAQLWDLSAYAAAEGLDADAAILRLARAIAGKPPVDPMTDLRYAVQAVSEDFAAQRADGAGWHPALPWLPPPDYATLRDSPRLAAYVHEMNATIAIRTAELRTEVITARPRWLAGLGPMPLDPGQAARWAQLAGLAAAYRDTYGITTDDPRVPLGEKPEGLGLRARAWTELIDHWTPVPATTPSHLAPARDALRADLDPDELMAELAADDVDTGTEAPLAELNAAYRRAVWAARDADFDLRARALIESRLPEALGNPAEPGLLALLRTAEDSGWELQQIVPDKETLHPVRTARDPAAVLYRRVQHRLERIEPPREPQPYPVGPLPWLTTLEPEALAQQPGLAATIADLDKRIATRVGEISNGVEWELWSAALGERPSGPDAAQRWDDLARQVAAYRDSYRIASLDPSVVLGPRPDGDGPRARAWQQIANRLPSGLAAEDEALDAPLGTEIRADHALGGAPASSLASLETTEPHHEGVAFLAGAEDGSDWDEGQESNGVRMGLG